MDNRQMIKLMSNNYRGWLCEESLKIPLLSTHFKRQAFTYFIYMDPHTPNKLTVTKYCFLILGDDASFFFFLCFSFLCFVTLFILELATSIKSSVVHCQFGGEINLPRELCLTEFDRIELDTFLALF